MGTKLSFPLVPLPKEKTVIVTGGNTGIGYETAKWIAMMGATVIIACRSQERAQNAIERMKTEFQAEKDKHTEGISETDTLHVEFMQVDLASLRSVKSFIEEFRSSGRQLHTLICNAGIAMHPQHYTEDDNELMFQVNYLSHFLIAAHFIPIMKKSGDDCRIINVSSEAIKVATFDISTIQGKQSTPENFDRLNYYGRSKLYQIMQMYKLNRCLQGSNITVSSIHPGIVETEINRSFTDLGRWKVFFGLSKLIGVTKTPFEGARTTINVAVNPQLAGIRDVYYSDCKPASTVPIARKLENQEALWEYSKERLKDYLPEEVIKELEDNTPI